MAGATEGDAATEIFRLMYRSHSRIPEERRKAALGDLFSEARANNKGKDVTGALLVDDDWFVQVLEGEETTVRGVYNRIVADPRHERVTLVEESTVPNRVFSRWSMAKVAVDGESDIPLLTNRNKGGAVEAAPRPTTPEQDQIVDHMHAVARDV